MNLFDIMGPVMVGPSSSHTAGAVRIGRVSLRILGERVKSAKIHFHGSFALTGVGHGTDKAVVAGLMDMETYDIRIPRSFDLARERGMEFTIDTVDLKDAHPNTVLMELKGESKSIKVQASSLGGGRISIDEIDDIKTGFTAEYPTLVVHNLDKAGHAAQVTKMLAEKNINIASLRSYRDKRGGFAIMVVETDEPIPVEAICELEKKEGIIKVTYINVV